MVKIALLLFVVAALIGLTLVAKRLKNQNLPLGLALLHGAFAAAGLVVLIIGTIQAGMWATVTLPLILFVIAALGGFILFSFHLKDKILPVPLAAIHGLLAVAAFVVLLSRVIR